MTRASPTRFATRYAEIVYRFFYGTALGLALGDPHPGNYLLCADGHVAFFDFGMIRRPLHDDLRREAVIDRGVREGRATVMAGMREPRLSTRRTERMGQRSAVGLHARGLVVAVRRGAAPACARGRVAWHRRAPRGQRPPPHRSAEANDAPAGGPAAAPRGGPAVPDRADHARERSVGQAAARADRRGPRRSETSVRSTPRGWPAGPTVRQGVLPVTPRAYLTDLRARLAAAGSSQPMLDPSARGAAASYASCPRCAPARFEHLLFRGSG
jgi:hypothetical protein